MQLRDVIRRRRMVRRFDPDRPVPREVLLTCLDHAVRAPSAGFSQGWDFLVLLSDEERSAFWAATADLRDPDTWLQGVQTAPALLVCLSDPDAYLERYAEPDKGWTDRALERWPVPYWDVDVGMAALLVLLTAVDEGLGALFFGVPGHRHEPLKAAFGIPPGRRVVGVVALGYAAPSPRSSSLRRGRRRRAEVAHWGRFGQHAPAAGKSPWRVGGDQAEPGRRG